MSIILASLALATEPTAAPAVSVPVATMPQPTLTAQELAACQRGWLGLPAGYHGVAECMAAKDRSVVAVASAGAIDKGFTVETSQSPGVQSVSSALPTMTVLGYDASGNAVCAGINTPYVACRLPQYGQYGQPFGPLYGNLTGTGRWPQAITPEMQILTTILVDLQVGIDGNREEIDGLWDVTRDHATRIYTQPAPQ